MQRRNALIHTVASYTELASDWNPFSSIDPQHNCHVNHIVEMKITTTSLTITSASSRYHSIPHFSPQFTTASDSECTIIAHDRRKHKYPHAISV